MSAAAGKKSAKSKGRYHHGNLREALLEAALALIEDRGPRGFTLREVARRAGVSHTAPYRHFVDKDALLAAVAEDGFARLDQAIADASAASASAALGFREAGIAYIRFALAHPAHYRIMFGDSLPDPAPYPDLAEVGQRSFQRLIESIEAAQTEGAVRAGDPMALAMAAWSMVHGLSSLLIDGRLDDALAERTTDELIDLVTGTLFTGLGR